MIIDSLYEVIINAANYQHYSRFFPELKCGQSVFCRIDQLITSSRVLIEAKCDKCDTIKSIKFKDYNSYGYIIPEYLCRKCKIKENNRKKWGVDNVFQLDSVREKIKRTNLTKWGVENVSQAEAIKQKKQTTNLQRFGVVHPLQSENIKEKLKVSNLTNWGVDNVSKSDIIKNKKKSTHRANHGTDFVFQLTEFKQNMISRNIEKWGVSYSFQSEEIISKIKQTNLSKWGYENPASSYQIKEKIKHSVTNTLNRKTFENIQNLVSIDSDKKYFEVYCDSCNTNYEIGYSLFYKRRETGTVCCTNCNPIDKNQSGLEIQLYQYIKSIYGKNILQNFRLNNKEFDIVLPDDKIAFEFNGVYWHSELFKERNYHQLKWRIAKQNDFKLFQIWEDDWLTNNDLVKSMIKSKLGLVDNRIFARKCDWIEADNSKVKEFLNKNHIQGSCLYTFALCLSFNDDIVSVMTFVKRKDYYELNRFCNRKDTIVIGAASRLLKRFRNTIKSSIITFSDNCYSTGELYENLGFKIDYELKPDYKFIQNGIRRHKFNFRQNNESLLKIWDAGKTRFSLTSKL